jgi:hypothetical protein
MRARFRVDGFMTQTPAMAASIQPFANGLTALKRPIE